MKYQAYIVCFTTDTADICMEPRASRRAAVADAETLFTRYGGDYRAVVVDLEQRANGWGEEAVIYSIAAGEEIEEAPAPAQEPISPMFALTIANLRGILLEVSDPNDTTVMDMIYELKQLQGVDITETSALRGIELLNEVHNAGFWFAAA